MRRNEKIKLIQSKKVRSRKRKSRRGKRKKKNAKNLVDGIELTEKDLILTLSRHGVKVVPGVAVSMCVPVKGVTSNGRLR